MNIMKTVIPLVGLVVSAVAESIVEDGVKLLTDPSTMKRSSAFGLKIGTALVAGVIGAAVAATVEKQLTDITNTVNSIDTPVGETIAEAIE